MEVDDLFSLDIQQSILDFVIHPGTWKEYVEEQKYVEEKSDNKKETKKEKEVREKECKKKREEYEKGCKKRKEEHDKKHGPESRPLPMRRNYPGSPRYCDSYEYDPNSTPPHSPQYSATSPSYTNSHFYNPTSPSYEPTGSGSGSGSGSAFIPHLHLDDEADYNMAQS